MTKDEYIDQANWQLHGANLYYPSKSVKTSISLWFSDVFRGHRNGTFSPHIQKRGLSMISPPETRIYIHWDFFKTFPFGKIRIRNFVAYAQRSLHGGKVKHSLRVKSSNPRVTSSNSWVASSNLWVTSSNPRVTSSNPRVRRLKARVRRLKAWLQANKPTV